MAPKQLALSYNAADSDNSALDLVYQVYPHWKIDPGPVKIIRFTGGIMNTLLKITKQAPGRSDFENDRDSVLLRAYGQGSDILVDREMEVKVHGLLAEQGIAPPLFARFENGLLYGFVPGRTCETQDISKEQVWRAIARRLGQWHGSLPLPQPESTGHSGTRTIWTVFRQWLAVLPSRSPKEEDRKAILQRELDRVSLEFSREGQENYRKNIVGHCDLFSANIILPPRDSAAKNVTSVNEEVHFIDYEFAVSCSAAFDLATFFSEWGGYECDYNLLPTQKTRRKFIEEYAQTYLEHCSTKTSDTEQFVDGLCQEVDRYRGMPGFYWGVHALILGEISDIQLDWETYAELRLAEFWAWRREVKGDRARSGEEINLRERRWAQAE